MTIRILFLLTVKQVIYLTPNGDLYRTIDLGSSWQFVNNFPNARCMDIKDSTGVIAGILGTLYVSSDNGNSWQQMNTDSDDLFERINIVSRDTFC
jgi:photosystem II stability/assembly factor-like uncharacterized protein